MGLSGGLATNGLVGSGGGGAAGPGVVQMDSGSAPTVDHTTALTDGNALVYNQAAGKFKGAVLLGVPNGAVADDLFYYNGTGYTRLPIGSEGQQLKVVSGVPAWSTVSAGGGSGDPSSNPANNGYLAWSYPLTVLFGTGTSGPKNYLLTAGKLSLVRVDIATSVTVNNVVIDQNQNGNTLTGSFTGIYSSAGTLLGQSADQSTHWASGAHSPDVIALTAPVSLAGGTFVWVALLTATASVAPGVRGIFQSNAYNYGLTAATYRVANAGASGVLTLPGSITPASNTSDNLAFWCALS